MSLFFVHQNQNLFLDIFGIEKIKKQKRKKKRKKKKKRVLILLNGKPKRRDRKLGEKNKKPKKSLTLNEVLLLKQTNKKY